MNATVQKWGNSLALRIPKSFVEETHLTKGCVVDLSVRDGKLVIDPARKQKYRLEDLLKRVSKSNLHSEVDTGHAVGRDGWDSQRCRAQCLKVGKGRFAVSVVDIYSELATRRTQMFV